MDLSYIKPGAVYTFKLNSGEEVIGKVLELTDDTVVLQDPVSIAPSPKGMQLVPSIFTADAKENVRLNTTSVSLVAKTADEVTDKYREATTGITVPEKKLVLG
jgi:hypothetical protein|tara:strand:- start:441 stop:749 length:309 start_codon:yes stop_codon:yes gene_type:complete